MNDSTSGTTDITTPDDDTVNEQFRPLLEGLRTSLPSVQVLLAFLLTAPLQAGFDEFTRQDKLAFSIAFYAAGLSSVLLIAPSVHQRIRAPLTGLQRQSKSHLVFTTWVTIVGSITMGVAMPATTYMVSHVLYESAPAIIATVVITTALLWAWFYLPLVTFNRLSDRERRPVDIAVPLPPCSRALVPDAQRSRDRDSEHSVLVCQARLT